MEQIQKYYEVLGIAPQATLEEIKQAYLDLVTIWRPDKYTHDPRLYRKAADKIREIDLAYQKLLSILNGETANDLGRVISPDNTMREDRNKIINVRMQELHDEKKDKVVEVKIIKADEKASDIQAVDHTFTNAHISGVGGWLLFLCIYLTIAKPLLCVLYFIKVPGIHPMATAITFWSVWVGVRLWKRDLGAHDFAKGYFSSMMALSSITIVLALIMLFTMSAATLEQLEKHIWLSPSEAFIAGFILLAWFSIWHEYLKRSVRVKATYSTNTANTRSRKPSRYRTENIQSHTAKKASDAAYAKAQLREALQGIDRQLDINTSEKRPSQDCSVPKNEHKSPNPFDLITEKKNDKSSNQEHMALSSMPKEGKILTSEDPILGMPSVEINSDSETPLFFRVAWFLIKCIAVPAIVIVLVAVILGTGNTSAPNQKKITSVPSGNTAEVNSNARQDTGTTVAQSSDHPQDPKSLTSVNSSLETNKSGQPSTSNITGIYAYARYGISDGVAIEIPRNWVIWDQNTIIQLTNIEKELAIQFNQPNNILLAAGTDLMEKSPSAEIRISMRLGDYPSQQMMSKASLENAAYRSETLKRAQNMMDQVKAASRGQIRNIRVIDARYEMMGKYTSYVLESEFDFVNSGLHANRIDYIYMSDRVYKINTAYKISEEHTYKNIMQHVRQSFSDSRR